MGAVKFKRTELTANTTSYRASWSRLDLNESLSSLYLRYRAEAESSGSDQEDVVAPRPAGHLIKIVSND